MKTFKNESAQVAALIKAELKEKFPNTKFSVRSEVFAGGDAVRVSYDKGTNSPNSKDVEKITNKFQMGYFDGMTDSYEYTYKGKGPTAKYISVYQEYPKEVTEAARTMIPRSASPEVYRDTYDKLLVTMGF